MTTMKTAGTAALSEYDGRNVEIEVTSVCRQDVIRKGNYTVKVPFSRMCQAMQNINRLGGKVAGVTVTGGTVAKEPSAK